MARRPTHKRVSAGAAEAHRTQRDALAADVRKLCIERLAAVGFDWAANEKRAQNVDRLAQSRDRTKEGRGRPIDERARLVKELDYKLYFGGKDGPSPEQYACLWLLLRGIGHVTADKLAGAIDALTVIDDEREAFKKAVSRHGQQVPWFPANRHVVVDGKATIEPADDADEVFEKRDPSGTLLYRYGMKRAAVKRRGLRRPKS